MVCRLSEEGLLPRWKKDVLVKNLSGRHLVVLCYSGLDFEICPEILNIQLHSLIWNFLRNPNRRKSELTEYAKRMLEKFNKSTTYGDVSFSLSNLGVKIASIIPDKKILHKNKSDFGKKLKSAFSEIELLEWSCALMAQPGYARQTKEVSDKLLVKIKKPSLDSGKYYSFQAEALFFMGKYRDAVKFCGKASEIFLNFKIGNCIIFLKSGKLIRLGVGEKTRKHTKF
jgi:hypothetical protein